MISPVKLNTFNTINFKGKTPQITHIQIEEDVFAPRTYSGRFDEYDANGANIERKYLHNSNTNETKYDFLITRNGKTLVNISRSFKKTDTNKTQTTVNGKEYQAEFFDDTKTIEITKPNNEKQIIDMGKRLNKNVSMLKFLMPDTGFDTTKEKTEAMWQNCKNLPCDLLLDIDKYVENWVYCKNINSFTFTKKNFMATGFEEAFILHEIGHFKGEELAKDKNLRDIFQSELELFDKNFDNEARKEIGYYTKKDGLEELTADINLIASTYGYADKKVQQRINKLVSNFPLTISYVLAKY